MQTQPGDCNTLELIRKKRCPQRRGSGGQTGRAALSCASILTSCRGPEVQQALRADTSRKGFCVVPRYWGKRELEG